jgi:hypothetical protein
VGGRPQHSDCYFARFDTGRRLAGNRFDLQAATVIGNRERHVGLGLFRAWQRDHRPIAAAQLGRPLSSTTGDVKFDSGWIGLRFDAE